MQTQSPLKTAGTQILEPPKQTRRDNRLHVEYAEKEQRDRIYIKRTNLNLDQNTSCDPTRCRKEVDRHGGTSVQPYTYHTWEHPFKNGNVGLLELKSCADLRPP